MSGFNYYKYRFCILSILCVVIFTLFVAMRDIFDEQVVATTALAAGGVIKNQSGYLIAIHGYNSGPTQFLHIYNTTAVPADTAVPILVIKINGSDNFYIDTTDRGMPFTTGISWSNSSTLVTKTAGAADIWLVAEYR